MGDTFSLGGMLLGTSSAATQVEGGDKNNNWYDWYRRGNIKDGSDPSVATMHWERWRDTELMAGMGLQCCRLGLEWSRIEPERGVFDESAVAHYVEELRALNERGIKPMVTLWHFEPALVRALGRFPHARGEARLPRIRRIHRPPTRAVCGLLDNPQRAQRLRRQQLYERRLAAGG